MPCRSVVTGIVAAAALSAADVPTVAYGKPARSGHRPTPPPAVGTTNACCTIPVNLARWISADAQMQLVPRGTEHDTLETDVVSVDHPVSGSGGKDGRFGFFGQRCT